MFMKSNFRKVFVISICAFYVFIFLVSILDILSYISDRQSYHFGTELIDKGGISYLSPSIFLSIRLLFVFLCIPALHFTIRSDSITNKILLLLAFATLFIIL